MKMAVSRNSHILQASIGKIFAMNIVWQKINDNSPSTD
jgi:hypothetical protein